VVIVEQDGRLDENAMVPGDGDKLHIAIDLDDCLLDFMGGLQRAVRTEHAVDIPDFTEWDLNHVLDPVLGQDWWEWLRERDWLWPNFPAIDGAIGAVKTLRRAGHFTELVTAKPLWGEYVVWRWLGKWRPPLSRVTIIDLDERKIDATDADVLIDDRPVNAVEFARDGRTGILFSRSHNASYNMVEPGLYRAKDWAHALKLIEEEQEETLC